uniref:Sec-independent protein translocase component n=1 Tax=Nitzschia alba TaxID=2858 RepID=A0A5C0F3S8_NITAL|nr:Sec-independent protein translocase component [Nitzschia alba]QEI59611.1 Sec-independent protein translocase component [Nitzschia alba]
MINFNFLHNPIIILKLTFFEHIIELYERLVFIIKLSILLIGFSFLKVYKLISILKYPVQNIKFFQFSPNEYFITTFKIAFYNGIFFTSPFIIGQFIIFLFPGLKKKEIFFILLLILSSIILFFLSFIFSYYILIPTTINFFLNYNETIIEPFWSFNQYFEFICNFFFNTGLIFQIPIFQVILELFNIIPFTQILYLWKYIILLSTILGAILTPSTDPLTQIFFSLVLIILYSFGLIFIYLIRII